MNRDNFLNSTFLQLFHGFQFPKIFAFGSVGRTSGRVDGRSDGRSSRTAVGWTGGRKDAWSDGRTVGRTLGRLDASVIRGVFALCFAGAVG